MSVSTKLPQGLAIVADGCRDSWILCVYEAYLSVITYNKCKDCVLLIKYSYAHWPNCFVAGIGSISKSKHLSNVIF
jgi:hypothetical protein